MLKGEMKARSILRESVIYCVIVATPVHGLKVAKLLVMMKFGKTRCVLVLLHSAFCSVDTFLRTSKNCLRLSCFYLCQTFEAQMFLIVLDFLRGSFFAS